VCKGQGQGQGQRQRGSAAPRAKALLQDDSSPPRCSAASARLAGGVWHPRRPSSSGSRSRPAPGPVNLTHPPTHTTACRGVHGAHINRAGARGGRALRRPPRALPFSEPPTAWASEGVSAQSVFTDRCTCPTACASSKQGPCLSPQVGCPARADSCGTNQVGNHLPLVGRPDAGRAGCVCFVRKG
jgi:hypothetical protein